MPDASGAGAGRRAQQGAGAIGRKRSFGQARRTRPRQRGGWAALRRLGPMTAVLALATVLALAAALWERGGLPQWAGTSAQRQGSPPAAALLRPNASDHDAARFSRCGFGPRIDCVVDGDTFWYHGDKIRIADINAPEVSHPQCASEARLAARATDRLQQLLNAGAFSLESIDRDRDKYGRLLRTVTRGGQSVGEVLVQEGLAERWKGYRGNWC